MLIFQGSVVRSYLLGDTFPVPMTLLWLCNVYNSYVCVCGTLAVQTGMASEASELLQEQRITQGLVIAVKEGARADPKP